MTKVIIVEDDVEFAATLARAVSIESDMEILGKAHDAAQARKLLCEVQPDVVLLDLGLPDENGRVLIREIAARYPECDVMVVTIFADDRNIVDAIGAGATGYLLKDTPTEHIAEQVATLRQGGSPISPKIARRVMKLFAPRSEVAVNQPVGLSERELEMLQLAAKGFSYEEIAGLMGISRQTVLTYVKRCYRKLQVNSKSEAIYEARLQGLVHD
ncbi:MAG: response regulator transcription factor [Rhodocyclales bacterium]|nr:response regulator transcription factor [Rhodocyclales bacterium]